VQARVPLRITEEGRRYPFKESLVHLEWQLESNQLSPHPLPLLAGLLHLRFVTQAVTRR